MENFLEDNEDNMNDVASDALKDAIDAAGEAYKSTDVDVLWEGVIAANKAMTDARVNVNAYQAFVAAVEEMNETADSYYDEASPKAQTAFDGMKDVVADDLTAEEIDALTIKVKDVTALLKIPAYDNASDATPVDMTSVIVNNGFETGNLEGWTNSGTIDGQTQNNTSFDNKQGTYYAEKWHVNGTVDINQTVAHLPAGTYDITAYVYSSATDCVLYANDGSVAVTTSGLYTVTVKLEEGADLKFGVSWSDSGDKWTCMDEFTLTYYGTASEKEETSTDIDEVESAAKAVPVAIFNAAGAQVGSLQNGVNIIKFSDGSIKKVLK